MQFVISSSALGRDIDLQEGKWVIIRGSWNIVYFLLAKAVVQASKDKSNFLTRWKTFHFQTSTTQLWATERKEPILNSNKKTKLLEILEMSSHQDLHLQKASCCIKTCTTSHHSQFKDTFIGKTSPASVTHMYEPAHFSFSQEWIQHMKCMPPQMFQQSRLLGMESNNRN